MNSPSLVAGTRSIWTTGTEHHAAGGNVGSQPVEAYDVFLPEVALALGNIASALSVSTDSLVLGPDERGTSDDFALLLEALNRLDDHHKDLARNILEAIALRAEANRWQQQPA